MTAARRMTRCDDRIIPNYSSHGIFLEGSIVEVIDLAAIRNASGLTQTQLATKLGVGQAAVSKIERQSDMLLSTLSAYLTALGVEAQIVVGVGEQTLTYDLTAQRRPR
jgi:DNA-binding XRE family transcriptional regulator